jgi:catechol 2,3-dioxygenase-like lactoylglutathione lyase family enzyme
MADAEASMGEERMPVTGLVPMIPVTDIERSVEFYKLLGFAVGNRVPRDGRMNWAWLYAPAAADWRRGPNLMFTRSQQAIDPRVRGVLFYLYANDLPGLREQLVTAGQSPGPIEYPEYLPEGEFSIQDPDGYCLMLAQSTSDTP